LALQRPPLSQPPPHGKRAMADVIDFDRVPRDLLGGLIHEYQLAA
jgi:hypothetical protein